MSTRSIPTIRDVAKAAGVSIATVSRVVNDAARVTDETRDRVRAVVDRMGYVPHGGARTPAVRRARTVGVLLPELDGERFADLLRGIDQTARRHGFLTLVTGARRESADLSALLGTLRGRLDGIVAVSPSAVARAALAGITERCPTVLVDSGGEGGTYATLSVDNFQGAAAMMRHLLTLGHRRIVFLRGPAGQPEAAERLHAVREVANWYDDVELIELPGEFRTDVAYHAVAQLLQSGVRPHAIFAANDAMAIGAISAARDADLQVPDDLAVAGFGDTPAARFLSPPLTTVRLPLHAVGERAALRLIEALDRGHAPRSSDPEVLPAQLVVRASCGAGHLAAATASAT